MKKLFFTLKHLGIVTALIACVCSIVSLSVGMIEFGLLSFFISVAGGSLSTGSEYYLKTIESLEKSKENLTIPSEMKVRDSDNQDEDMEKQPIFVVSPEKIGFETEKTKELELKDSLYYDDMIYEIKNIAGFPVEVNFETLERIEKRQEYIKAEETCIGYCLSPFQTELFEIIRGISKKAGVSFKGLGEISKYPELVNEALVELANKKDLNAKLLAEQSTSKEDIQKFDVLAVPNSRNNAFAVSSKQAEELLNQHAEPKVIEENAKRAEEFRTNNLSQEAKSKKLTKN